MITSIQTDDNEYARYLAQYIVDHGDLCVHEVGDYGFYLDYEELYKVICEFENSLL